MKTSTIVATVLTATLLACGGGDDGGGGGGGRDGGSGGPDASPPGDGPFALHLTVSAQLTSGEPATTFLYVAVRDAESHEIIAFVHEDENLVSSVEIAEPAALQKGHRYQIGVKDTWYASCLDPSANVWYRELPAVSDDVDLAFDVTGDVDEDPRGCDVLHEPVGLDPGEYTATVPVLDIAGNRIALLVSDSGRLYTDEMRIFCGDTSDCLSTTVLFDTCDLEEAIYPGDTSFSLGSEAASATTVEGKATIDPTSQTVRYVGRVYTWHVGSGTICCDENFDVTLTRQGAPGQTCP